MTFDGEDWRTPEVARAMVRVFPIVRALHELLALLDQALGYENIDLGLVRELRRARVECERHAFEAPDILATLDVAPLRRRIGSMLRRVSLTIRTATVGVATDLEGADLSGAQLAGKDFRGANLRGASLVGADLRRTKLGSSDLLGTDLRGARLQGADLRECLFATSPQLATAYGDAETRLPDHAERPGHWPIALRRRKDGDP